MKTRILSVITLIVTVLGISKFTYAANSTNLVVTTLSDISNINKIEVHGNVELFISDGSADQVKVYNKYYAESALIQSRNGVLRISSYKNEKLVVWVTATDLRSISVYDNAEVKSFGQLSKIEFNVDLHNNATASLNLDAFNTTLLVNDQAKANLTGVSNEFNLTRNVASNVISNNFKAAHFSENKISLPVQAANDDVVVGI